MRWIRISNVITLAMGLGGCAGTTEPTDGATTDGASEACPEDEKVAWFADVDGDLYGDSSLEEQGCTAPVGFVSNSHDCNDTSVISHPGAVEICDGLDNDCNDLTDDDPVDVSLWFPDVDLDTFGDESAIPTEACDAPDGMVGNALDCDDTTGERAPDLEEVCDGKDNDCDGDIDLGAIGNLYQVDVDGDGYGDPTFPSIEACAAPDGYVDDDTDCDDGDGDVNPDAAEICGDSVDNDCAGGDLPCVAGEFLLDPLAAVPPQVVIGTASFGISLEIADVSGDGVDDLIIGSSELYEDGGAYIFHGGPGFTLPASFTQADTILSGLAQEAAAFLTTGDINNDGHTDLMIGTGYHGGGGYGFYGPIEEPLLGYGSADLRLVSSLSVNAFILGDVNDDGTDDIGCGFVDHSLPGNSSNGRFTINHGSSTLPAELDCFDNFTFAVDGRHDTQVGTQIASVGDINADGVTDFATTAGRDRGVAYAFYGGSVGDWPVLDVNAFSITGERGGAALRALSRHPGDVNGDGYDDILVGAPRYDLGGFSDLMGFVALHFMPDVNANISVDSADVQIRGVENNGELGTSLDMGDFNGDGKADIVFSGPYLDYGGVTDAGATFLMYGGDLSGSYDLEDADLTFGGTVEDGDSGRAHAMGDLDGDGLLDIAIGAPGADIVYVFLGSQLN